MWSVLDGDIRIRDYNNIKTSDVLPRFHPSAAIKPSSWQHTKKIHLQIQTQWGFFFPISVTQLRVKYLKLQNTKQDTILKRFKN